VKTAIDVHDHHYGTLPKKAVALERHGSVRSLKRLAKEGKLAGKIFGFRGMAVASRG
jgi:hypothetical protein